MNNIEELIQKISKHTGLSRAEIKTKIDQKKEELGFFVNDIAAAHIIAKDLNVPIDRPKLKKRSKITIKTLKNMEPGLSGVNLIGVISRIYQPIEFTKEGRKGILTPILFHDGTDYIRTVLWGNMTRYITEKKVKRGSIININQAYTKLGRNNELELHLGDRGSLEVDQDAETTDFPNPDEEILNLENLDGEMREADIKAIVFKIGNMNTFNRADGTEGRVANLILQGEHVKRRMVFWDTQAEQVFNFTRGDELLIQAATVKMDREGKPEIHANRATYTLKVGHKSLPDLEDEQNLQISQSRINKKKLDEINSEDSLVSIIVRKGPVSEPRSFTRKDGSPGSVKRAIIFDETGSKPLVIWDEFIPLFDELKDGPFEITKARVNMSRYSTIELHTISTTEFLLVDSALIAEEPPIQNISDITPDNDLVCIQGVIQQVSEVREFNRSDGTIGRVASMTIQDTTGSCRVVVWDDKVNVLESIQKDDLKFTKVYFGRVRQNEDKTIEIHLNFQSHVRPSSRIPTLLRDIQVSEVKASPQQRSPEYHKLIISELADNEDGMMLEIFGKIIQLFQQVPYYWACPECRKKVIETDDEKGWICGTHNLVEPKITMRLSGIIDDGTGTIRTTFFGRSAEILTGMSSEDVKKLMENNLTDDEIFSAIQSETEGKSLLVQGKVQLQTREVQGETMQSQTLFANRVLFPPPQILVENLISELQQ